MFRKIGLMTLAVLLTGSAVAIDIIDTIEAEHISPVAVYATSPGAVDPPNRDIEFVINRNLSEGGAMWLLNPPSVAYIIFDMGSPVAFETFNWWNRPTSGNIAAENVDFYIFAGDVPKDSYDIEGDVDLIGLDQDVVLGLEQPGLRGNDDVIMEEIAFSSAFTARYIGLRFDDGQQSDQNNIQINEIAFTAVDPNATYLNPGDVSTVRPEYLVLSWTPGVGAVSHDVYFGTDYNDVNYAGRGADADGSGQVGWGDVLVLSANWLKDIGSFQPYADVDSDDDVDAGDFVVVADAWGQPADAVFMGNQDGNSFAAWTLEYGRSYYWRIDEVGASGISKGDVWMFSTVEFTGMRPLSRVVLVKKLAMGDFRSRTLHIGDLNGDGQADFLFVQNVNQDITCLTALELNGTELWQVGQVDANNYVKGFDLAVQIYDIDLDGTNEVICVMDGELKILDGRDGTVERAVSVPSADARDCIVIANFSGNAKPQDILVKNRYNKAWALDPNLDLLWSYTCKTGHYPWPYDFDDDGRDELMLGYTLVDDDGSKIWEAPLAGHADAVAIGNVDGNSLNGMEIALAASGTDDKFVLLDQNGQTLWQHSVDHAQHIIIGDFRPELPGLEVCGLDRGNDRSASGVDAMVLYSADGTQLWHEVRTDSGSNRWLTAVSMVDNWDSSGQDLIFGYRRGGTTPPTLYDGYGEVVATFPFVDLEKMHFTQHADIWGDDREEIIIYNEDWLYIYTNGAANPKKRLYNNTQYIGMP